MIVSSDAYYLCNLFLVNAIFHFVSFKCFVACWFSSSFEYPLVLDVSKATQQLEGFVDSAIQRERLQPAGP